MSRSSGSWSCAEQRLELCEAFLDGRNPAIELHLVNLLQQDADVRARRDAVRQHVAAEHERLRRAMFDAERARPLQEPVHRAAVEGARHAAETIGRRDAREQFEKQYFLHHIRREEGNMSRVADRVGLERTHLYRKLKQLGIRPSGKGEDVSGS